jgi:hypothetical protein
VRRAFQIITMLLLTGAHPCASRADTSDGAASIDGSVRAVVGVFDNYDDEALFEGDAADLVTQAVLRMVVSGRPRDTVAYELHGLQTFTYSSAPRGPASRTLAAGDSDNASAGSDLVRYRALDLKLQWHDDSRTVAALSVDRANATFSFGKFDLTIGRQAVTFGKAYFWSILDVFLPFDPAQFDRDYKPGVDAVRLDLALGAFSGLNLVAVAGPEVPAVVAGRSDDDFWEASWFGSSVLTRAFTNLAGWDLAIQAGKVFGGYQIGAGAVGEAGPLELRLEAVRHFAKDSPPLTPFAVPGQPSLDGQDLVEDSTSLVVGSGRRFESSLTVELEYFRNGAGDADLLEASVLRSASGGLLSWSENLLGAALTYELSPIVLGSLGSIVSLDDGSVQIQPRIDWSVGDELELLCGAIVNLGERPDSDLESEFGTQPTLFYSEIKYYF